MLCKKYQIIPKPNYKPKIFFNNDIINYLQKISSDKELPNFDTLFADEIAQIKQQNTLGYERLDG